MYLHHQLLLNAQFVLCNSFDHAKHVKFTINVLFVTLLLHTHIFLSNMQFLIRRSIEEEEEKKNAYNPQQVSEVKNDVRVLCNSFNKKLLFYKSL